MRTFSKNFSFVTSLAPALRAGSATGTTVDRLGFESLAFLITTGAFTNGSHAIVAEHSDDGTTWAAVPADQLAGTLPTVAASGDQNKTSIVGYSGDARYVRIKANVSGSPATGAIVGAIVMLGNARQRPVAA